MDDDGHSEDDEQDAFEMWVHSREEGYRNLSADFLEHALVEALVKQESDARMNLVLARLDAVELLQSGVPDTPEARRYRDSCYQVAACVHTHCRELFPVSVCGEVEVLLAENNAAFSKLKHPDAVAMLEKSSDLLRCLRTYLEAAKRLNRARTMHAARRLSQDLSEPTKDYLKLFGTALALDLHALVQAGAVDG